MEDMMKRKSNEKKKNFIRKEFHRLDKGGEHSVPDEICLEYLYYQNSKEHQIDAWELTFGMPDERIEFPESLWKWCQKMDENYSGAMRSPSMCLTIF